MRAVALALLLAVAALPTTLAEPTPGVSASLERIVPEPTETNDYVSYPEARDYLRAIAEAAPDYAEVLEVGPSVGWDTVSGSHDTFQVLAVEVTNEQSAVPRADKKALVFQLSIHGNEKGGREGGLRVIEDLAVPRGMGQDHRALLDRVIVVFTFPNVDGWMHEEAPYRHNCNSGGVPFVAPAPDGAPCIESQGYVRQNGHWQDMNRDWPTLGWYQTGFGRENALSEPEITALHGYLLQFRGRTLSASDIHGMLTPADGGVSVAGPLPVPFVGGDGGSGRPSLCLPENPAGVECAAKEGHFILGMVRGYPADAGQMFRDVRLSQNSQDALQGMADAQFPYWGALPNAGVAGGEFMEYGTVWDTLGYSDSGFTGLWLAQTLQASGVDYEMSYNHVTFDNHYVPELNKMHVESVRAIVGSYLKDAEADLAPRLVPAQPIAWLDDPRTVRSVPAAQQEGAHQNATTDDGYEAARDTSPQRFWRDLARFAAAGSIAPVSAADLAAGRLQARVLVVTGDAWGLVEGTPGARDAVRRHVQGGGQLLLTDGALKGLEALGLASAGSVERGTAYMGYVELEQDHPLANGVRPLARQTFEGIPLGYALPGQGRKAQSPVWTVRADALQGADIAATSLAQDRASVGIVPLGQGKVTFIGALLPPASTEVYHPYGLADYAVSATGYTLVYNTLGIEVQEREGPAPAAADAAPAPPPQRTPGFEAVFVLAAVLALATSRRR